MFKNCNAMRVVTGGVKPIDGQYVQVLHFRQKAWFITDGTKKSKVFADSWGELFWLSTKNALGKRNKSLFQGEMVYCSFHYFLKI